MKLILVLVITWFTASTIVYAQDSSITVIDTTQKKIKKHSPTIASVLSAIVPGAGQIYNRKYWKAPIVWGGLAGLGYWISFNADEYIRWRCAYECSVLDTNCTNTDILSTSASYAKSKMNDARDNLDLSIILTSIFYILNIVDASVDAHLFTFDVGDDLTLQFEPYAAPMGFASAPNMGLSVKLKL